MFRDLGCLGVWGFRVFRALRGLGFRSLGFRVWEYRVLGVKVWGFRAQGRTLNPLSQSSGRTRIRSEVLHGVFLGVYPHLQIACYHP